MTDNRIWLPCECRTPDHFVTIERDPDVPGGLLIEVVATKQAGFWSRLKYGLIHIFGGDHLTVGDVILSPVMAENLRLHLGDAA